MRFCLCLSLLLLHPLLGLAADPQVPPIPATTLVPKESKTVTIEGTPADSPKPLKVIELKPKAAKLGKRKKAHRHLRDELVDSLKARIKALESQRDKDVVTSQIKGSIQRPVNSTSIESKTIYNYIPDAIYLIYGAINHMVDVQLQPGEKLSGPPVAGDTVCWLVGQAISGSGASAITHILIKPVRSNAETNFLITTDRHSYRLYARSSEDFFIPTVGWNYPEESMMAFAGIKSEQQRQDDLVAGPSLVASNLNFKYKLEPKGAYSWTPVRVFDDGVKTYIEMNPDMKRSEAPAFFIREKKELNLVNYRMRGDYIVVDRLFDQGELRSGEKDLVLISREQKHWWRSN